MQADMHMNLPLPKPAKPDVKEAAHPTVPEETAEADLPAPGMKIAIPAMAVTAAAAAAVPDRYKLNKIKIKKSFFPPCKRRFFMHIFNKILKKLAFGF